MMLVRYSSASCVLLLGCLVLFAASGCRTQTESEDDMDIPENAVVKETFDSQALGELGRRLIAHRHIDLVPEGGRSQGGIRVTYCGYERGSERVVVNLPLPTELEQATLIFDVFFEEEFQFTRGGKLHGLGPTIQNKVTGGRPMIPAGWSARTMWREQGSVISYIYHQDKDRKWGDAKRAPDFRFKTGRWYRVAMYCKLNTTPDLADGEFEIAVEGKTILSVDNLRYRADVVPGSGISSLLFSTFHGGNQPKWAPTDEEGNFIDVYARFDNFAVIPGKP